MLKATREEVEYIANKVDKSGGSPIYPKRKHRLTPAEIKEALEKRKVYSCGLPEHFTDEPPTPRNRK